ncbi:MAG: hypothetical protein ACR2KS_04745 [Candidatus Eremiobacter antarcticus]|nr:hypothetical protein [Candidatus Eremiobacteraeota bacterium]MBC5807328.1 hypothetical protein [Candidatus Eremiobacteraeota bacterium]
MRGIEIDRVEEIKKALAFLRGFVCITERAALERLAAAHQLEDLPASLRSRSAASVIGGRKSRCALRRRIDHGSSSHGEEQKQ